MELPADILDNIITNIGGGVAHENLEEAKAVMLKRLRGQGFVDPEKELKGIVHSKSRIQQIQIACENAGILSPYAKSADPEVRIIRY